MPQHDAGNADEPDDDVESSASFLRPRRGIDDEIDITPMIDCVFLLLIFFIVNFRADQSKSVPIPPAKYGNPVLGLDSVFISVVADEANTPQVYLGDLVDPKIKLRSTNLIDQEQEISTYVRGELGLHEGLEAWKEEIIEENRREMNLPPGKKQRFIERDGKRITVPAKKQVIIKADGKLTAGQVNMVNKAVAKALEGQSIHIAVREEKK